MDKHLLQILLTILLSAIIGLMDKVKFHYTQTWFSTIKKPDWLVRWLDPDWDFKATNKILVWLLTNTLAGFTDFWHFLKFLMLQTIFYLSWVSYHEGRLWVWLIVCNAIYGVIFEVVYQGMFNKKDERNSYKIIQSMITQQQIQEAEQKYPMPGITKWYLNKFPKKQFTWAMLIAFAGGFVSTILKKKKIAGISTLIFLLVLIPAAVIHSYAWVKMRICEVRRARFLGLTLREYWNEILHRT